MKSSFGTVTPFTPIYDQIILHQCTASKKQAKTRVSLFLFATIYADFPATVSNRQPSSCHSRGHTRCSAHNSESPVGCLQLNLQDGGPEMIARSRLPAPGSCVFFKTASSLLPMSDRTGNFIYALIPSTSGPRPPAFINLGRKCGGIFRHRERPDNGRTKAATKQRNEGAPAEEHRLGRRPTRL